MNVVKRSGEEKRFVLSPTPSTVSLTLTDQQQKQLIASLEESDGKSGLRLRLGGFKPSNSSWLKGGRVFLNLPDSIGEKDPKLLTPSSPYYVGSFAFYAADGDENSFYLAPAPAFSRLRQRDELSDTKTLRITLVGLTKSDSQQTDQSGTDRVEFDEVALKSTGGRSAK